MGREHYEQSKKLLLKLHELNVQGKDQTDEADEIREAMDAPARGLTSLERKRLKGLSADLYMLIGEEVKESAVLSDIDQEFLNSYRAKDWDRVLEILRKKNLCLEEHLVASTRAICWLEFGDYDVSLLFAEYAVKLNPDEANYPTFVKLNRAKLNGEPPVAQKPSPQQLVNATILELSLLQTA